MEDTNPLASMQAQSSTSAFVAMLVSSLILLLMVLGCASQSPKSTSESFAAGPQQGMPGYVLADIHQRIGARGDAGWTPNAMWDEYVLSIRNTSTVAISVTALEVSGDHGSRWHRLGVQALQNESMKDWTVEQTSEHLGAAPALAGALADMSCHSYQLSLLPVCLISAAIASSAPMPTREDRAQVEARGLHVPLGIPPGELIRGSAFFPIDATVDRLRLHLHIEGEDHLVEVPFLRRIAKERTVQEKIHP